MMIGIYVRESSKRQKGNWSNVTQRDEGIKWAKGLGVTAEIYEDILSGKDGSYRPEWERLKNDISSGKVDTLYFWNFRRLGRDNEESERNQKLLRKHNIKLYEGHSSRYVDITSHGGQLMYTIEGKLSELDNAARIDATRTGVKRQQDAGQRRYSGNLFGYVATATIDAFGRVKRTWHIEPEEAKLIRHIYDLAIDERLGLSAIERRLDAEHYKTRKGHRWTHDKIRNLLKQPLYAGLTTDSHGNLIPTTAYPADPPIVDPKRWRLMQAKYPEYVSSGKKGHPNEHLASGIIECAECGSRYTHIHTWDTHERQDGTISKYEKYNYSHNSRAECANRKNYMANAIDHIMRDAYYYGLFQGQDILTNLKGTISTDDLDDDLERLQRQIDANNKAKKNYMTAIEKGVELDTVVGRLKEIEADSKQIGGKMDAIREQIKNANLKFANAREVFATATNSQFQAATDKGRNAMIRQIVKALVADKDSLKVVYIDGSSRVYGYKQTMLAVKAGEALAEDGAEMRPKAQRTADWKKRTKALREGK